MFEITGEIPEPIFDEPQEAESLGRTWQALIGSQTLRRRSSIRYEKGTGDPPKRHRRGNFSKTRIEISVRVFCSLRIQSSIFGDPLSWFFQRTIIPNEMKDLNCITITPGK